MVLTYKDQLIEKITQEIVWDVSDADVCNSFEPIFNIVCKLLDRWKMTGDCPPDVDYQFSEDIARAIAKMVVNMAWFQGVLTS